MQMTLSSSSFMHLTSTQTLLTFKMLYSRSLPRWLPIFLTLSSVKTEFLLIGLSKDLSNSAPHTAHSLGFIFDEHLFFSDQISSLSQSCYYYIHQLRCICPYLDIKTAFTIATSIIHSKLDYCNSLLWSTQVSNNAPPADPEFCCTCFVKTSKICHITSHLTQSSLA